MAGLITSTGLSCMQGTSHSLAVVQLWSRDDPWVFPCFVVAFSRSLPHTLSSTSPHLISPSHTLSFLSVSVFLLYTIVQTISKWWYSPNDDALHGGLIPPLCLGLTSDALLHTRHTHYAKTIDKKKRHKIIKIKINMTAESPAFSDVFTYSIFIWRVTPTHSYLFSLALSSLSLALLSD